MIKRTEGISTTDLVGRMLMCKTRPKATEQASQPSEMHGAFSRQAGARGERDDPAAGGAGPQAGPSATRVSHFCPTSRRIRQFSSGRVPPPGARVVYMDGAFDMFHPGHVAALRRARSHGDFLLCGVHTDEAVSARRGRGHVPILSLHERSLSVLACRYVDEVVIGAPEVITQEFLTTFNVAVVLRGSVHEPTPGRRNGDLAACGEGVDPYALPRQLGRFVEMASPRDLTTDGIIQRILGNRERFEARNARKSKAEAHYVAHKQHVREI